MPYNGPRSSYSSRSRLYARHKREISRLKSCIKELRRAVIPFEHPLFGDRRNIYKDQRIRATEAVEDASRLVNSNGSTQIPEILSLRMTLAALLNKSDRFRI